MGYRYPSGAKSIDEKITDVVTSMSFVDVMIEYRIAHFFVSLNKDFDRSELLRLVVLSKLQYIDKIKILHMFLKRYDLLPDKSFMKDFQRMGEIRNKVAHESVLIVIDDKSHHDDNSVGNDIKKDLNKQYDEFNVLIEKYRNFIDDGSYMEDPSYYSKK